jgi:hypothetical protein
MATKPDTIFRALDRKAAAVTEFTMRQYRTKLSTWVVLITGFLMISLLLLFYIDGMQKEYESIDNDGDSYDWDGDGYPTGQERQYGTDPNSADSHPGLLDPPIEPDPPEKWIDEDDFDWDSTPGAGQTISVGYDDDGDCNRDDRTESQKDTNDNNVPCDIALEGPQVGMDESGFTVDADNFVDEDPDDAAYAKEAIHRASILAIGKLGFVFIIGIFVPLFLATGLIRDEMSSGTMHYMLSKPIARTEVFLYRILGYLGIVWPYLAILVFISAIVTGLAGPGDSFFRFSEFGIWLSVLFAAMLATLVYGMLFCFFGVLWRYGVILAIPFAAWELGMALLSMGVPEASILRFSVIGWALTIIDSAAILVWPDIDLFIQMGLWGGGGDGTGLFGSSIEGSAPLSYFSSKPALGNISPFLSMLISTVVLLIQAATLWLLGGLLFKGKEIE